MATVPTGLQTCAKMLQIHLSGGAGTPWMQLKSNRKFIIALPQLLKFLIAEFGFWEISLTRTWLSNPKVIENFNLAMTC